MRFKTLLIATFAAFALQPSASAETVACVKTVTYELPARAEKISFCAAKNGVLFSASCSRGECEALRMTKAAAHTQSSGAELAQNPGAVSCVKLKGLVTTGFDEAANEQCFCLFKKDKSMVSCGGLVR